MKRAFWGLIAILSMFYIASCSSSNNVVAEFGNNQITYDELKAAYEKNLSEEEKDSTISDDSLKEFADLYVNYKMKLRDAVVRGFDKDPEIQQEIEDYTKTVGVPYIEEKYIIDQGLKKLYDERKIEKRVSHILLRTHGKNADSLKQIANDLVKRIQNGESFEKLAKEYSEDQYTKNQGGDIYWITAGQTIPEFDRAVYKTKKGELYPEPIKTNYGYHIIKVTNEQPRVYAVHAQHILIGYKQDGKIDTAAALKKANMVKEKLNEGVPFEELAKKYSDDPGSKNKGGDLGFFERRMMVTPFDEAVFKLKPGEISDIVQTRYGFHIIQLIDVKEIPPFEEEKEKLKEMYKKRIYPDDRAAYIDSLKKEYSLKINDDVYQKFAENSADLTFGDTYWGSEIQKELGDKTLFTIAGEKTTVDDFMNEIKDDNKFKNFNMKKEVIEKGVDEAIGKRLLIHKAVELSKGDTEFARLMADYKKGLYIFKLQEEEIWNNLKIDTTKLEQFYEETKDQYVWPNRAAYDVIYRIDSTSIYKDKALLDSDTSFAAIIEINKSDRKIADKNGAQPLKVIMGDEVAEKAYNLVNPGKISKPFKTSDGWYIVRLSERIPSSPKTFEEAKSEVAGLWQEQQTKELEKEYIQKLRKIYEPEIYYDRLSEMQNN